MSRWKNLSRFADDVLIAKVPSGLVRVVKDVVARGASVEGCRDAATGAGAKPLLLTAVEALALRLVAKRDAGRN